MGTAQSKPANKKGKAVVNQKLENANKTGVLSLTEHNLEVIPQKVFELVNVRTLDLSNNKLRHLSVKLSNLKSIKSLNVEKNQLQTLLPIAKLTNLQTLNAGKNNLGIAPQKKLESKQKSPASKTASSTSASALASVHHHQSLPELPPSLKQLKLDSNHFDSIPKQILTNSLTKLVKVDLSHNNIASVPAQISLLSSLTELNLSYNMIPSIEPGISKLKSLKSLSLEYNAIHVSSSIMKWTDANPQPLPKGLFEDTVLIDLNLKGNNLTNTQLNSFDGFEAFLERRQKLKSKNIYGGALTDLSVCGLD